MNYLKHLIVNKSFEEYCFKNGTGPLNNIKKSLILKYRIPIPPLPVQQEIVRILDSFTELTAELAARHKQYEHYICPKDVLHPMYDCRFYADHITEQYEMPMTIQGVLRAIEAVKETLEDRKLRETERYRFVASILDSGATPDGQIVMVSVFLPLIEAVRQRQVLNRNDPVLTPIFAIK